MEISAIVSTVQILRNVNNYDFIFKVNKSCQILRDALNNGTDIDLESGEFHSNDVATLLKMFLGELPEPLLTHKHFHAHLKIAGEYWR